MNSLVVNSLLSGNEQNPPSINTCPPKSLFIWKNKTENNGNNKCDVTIPEVDIMKYKVRFYCITNFSE